MKANERSDTPVDVSIIVPARNEERRIQACLGKLALFLPRQDFKSEVVIAADSCTDNTVSLIQDTIDHVPFKLKLFYSPIPLGKGGAIREALRLCAGKYVVFMDVDLPVDPFFLKAALACAGDNDIVNGSRFLEGSERTDPLFRLLLSKAYHALCRFLFGIGCDTQCGFKLCKREAAEHVFDHVAADGFSFDTEFMVQAGKLGYRIEEIPVSLVFDRNTSLKAVPLAYRMLLDLIAIKLRTLKMTHGDRRNAQEAFAFYNKVPGDARWRASHSLFLPRRLWYKVKDDRVYRAVRLSPKSARILDLGCGSGVFMKRLLDNGYSNLHGVDVCIFAVTIANQLLGQGLAVWAEPSQLPFASETFDVVVCSEVIEHSSDLDKALEEIRRVLSRSGRMIITAPSAKLRWDLVEAVWSHVRRESLEFNHCPISPQRLRWSILKKGFAIRSFEPFLLGCEFLIEAVKGQDNEGYNQLHL